MWSQETLIIAVERYTVRAGGVVIDETEIKCTISGRLCRLPQVVEAFRYRPRRVLLVSPVGDLDASLCIYYPARFMENGRRIKAKDSRPPRMS